MSHRRDEYFLATKAGHVTGGYSGEPWASQTVADSIDRSLQRLRTDHVDIVQLHSCALDVLERGDAIEALVKARDAGKTRFIGYSGDNEAARWAVDSGIFDTLQTSYNVVDQSARTLLLDQAEAKGMGVIIKRPVANAVWGAPRSTHAYGDEYLRRARVIADMGPVPGEPEDSLLLAMGFVLAHRAVGTAIVGTHNPDHVRANIEMVEQDLPIAEECVKELQRRFDEVGGEWPGLT